MVEDSEIKTEVSPFAVREGEIKTFDGKDGYVSMNQIIHKINIGHIGEIHFKIMELINDFEFMTSRQIYQMLVYNKADIASQDKLNNKLEQLIKSKILTRYYFTSEEGKCIYRVYCLEKMGKYLLNSRGIECKWQPTDNTKTVGMIKKRLSGNQVIIAYLRKVSAFDKFVVKPELKAKKLGKTFKCHAGVKLSKNGKSIDLIFEAIRREDDWEDRFIDRIKYYIDFYESFIPYDSGYEMKPQLVLVCEDNKHVIEAYKIIITNKLEIPNIKLLFTTDLRQNSDSLVNSLMEFKVEDGKYKLEEVELKILG